MFLPADLITRVPLDTIMGYSHAGHLLMIRRGHIRAYYLQNGGPPGSGYAGVPPSDWKPTLLDQLALPPKFLAGIVKAVLDHAPWNYDKSIDKAIRDGTFPTEFQTK
jgi:hypothetical protein